MPVAEVHMHSGHSTKIGAKKSHHPRRVIYQMQFSTLNARRNEPRKAASSGTYFAADGLGAQVRKRRGLQQGLGWIPAQLRLLVVIDVNPQAPCRLHVAGKALGFLAEDAVAHLETKWSKRDRGAGRHRVTHGTHGGPSTGRRT